MSIELKRTADGTESRDASNNVSEYEIKYLCFGAKTKDEALNAVYAAVPKTYGNLAYAGCKFDGWEDGVIEVTAKYSASNNATGTLSGDQETEPTLSFDCSTGSAHIIKSRAQKKYPSTAKDAGGYIGWNGKPGKECEFAGVDKLTPVMRESYTRTIKRSLLTTQFKRNIIKLAGKVNDGKFKGWDAGEVLFLGASYSGADSNREKITVTYNFAIQENEADAKISEGISVPRKGWEYIWSDSKTMTVSETGEIYIAILGIYVDEIYEEKDFGSLGLK